MAGCRRPRKKEYCWKHFSTNRILLIITMVSVCVSQLCGPSSATDANRVGQTAADCPQSVTCEQCAARSTCSWSLRRQTCAGTSESSDSLRIHAPSNCPSFVAVNRFVAAGDTKYAYALRMTNLTQGFTEFLGRIGIRCDVAGVTLEGRVSGDTIECAPTPVAGMWRQDTDDEDGYYYGDVMVRHARVMFNGSGVTLRPDKVRDGYFAVSRQGNCTHDSWDKTCVTCVRHDVIGTEYFVRCSSRNQCTGLFEYRDAWPPRSRRRWQRPGSLSCEPDVRVRSVEPTVAPWTGGEKLRLTVNDHGILNEKSALSVTVAGRACADPKSSFIDPKSDPAADTVITCVVPPAAHADGPDGSVDATVRVRYALNGTLELAAADMSFRYVYPEITAVERRVRYAPGADDTATVTEWKVLGTLLDAGSRVQVFVGAEDVECQFFYRSRENIMCTVTSTAALEDVAADRLVVKFDGPLRVYAMFKPRWAVYVGEPAVDAGQSFRALASGDTALPVRGRRLLYVTRIKFYASGRDKVATRFGDCHVLNDTYATCVAPRLDEAVDDVGLLVDFAGRRDVRVPAANFSYTAYPDPVFKDFTMNADSGTIEVHGGGPDVGYSEDDVTVHLSPNPSGGGGAECEVTIVSQSLIVCESLETLDHVQHVVVTIGNRLHVQVAARKTTDHDGEPVNVSMSFTSAHRWTVLAVALAAVLAGVAAQLCLMRLKAKRRKLRAAAAAAAAAPVSGSRKSSDCSVRHTDSRYSSIDLTV